jgi:PST family polysaccharide transporter
LTAHQATTFGVAQYLVANPRSGPEVAWHVTAFQFILGALAFGAVVLLRDHFGGMLDAPTMGQYVPGLALAMFIERTGGVPERLLARQLKFRTIGIGRTVGEVTYTATSVALAWMGWGGMAIVYGNIMRNLFTFAILTSAVARSEWLVPRLLSMKTLRPMLRYGVPLSVGTFATFASRRWDNLVVSSIFGARVVGEYNLAYNLADIPAVQVGEQIGDVLFPSFSQMQPEQRRRALVRSTGLLALIVFPLAVGLGAISETLVHAVLRPEWYNVAPMLAVLSALSVVRPVGWTIGAFLQASNRTRAAMWLGLAKIAFLLTSLFVLGHVTKDPLWACAAVGIAFGLHSLASMYAVRQDGVSMRQLLWRCTTPLLATLPMYGAIVGVRHLLARAGLERAGVELVVELAVGGLAYVASALVVARSTAKDLLELVKDAVQRRRGKDPDSEPPLSERVAASLSQPKV